MPPNATGDSGDGATAPTLANAPTLLAVANVSEGRNRGVIDAIADAFVAGGDIAMADAGRVRLLDVHSDGDHHRSVFTLAGPPMALSHALLAGAAEAISRIDVMASAGEPTAGEESRREHRGEHPYVGALDVAPIVYLEESSRGGACAEALVLADRIGYELSVPVFLYGELTGGGGELDGGGPVGSKGRPARTRPEGAPPERTRPERTRPMRTRAELRRGGIAGLRQRIAAGEVRPDFGPPRLHPSAGATLVGARPPLVAFNLLLASPATVADARRIAALIREGGPEGLPGVRAMGVSLGGSVGQVSMNVERPFETPLAMVLERVRRHGDIASGELVGLAPEAALAGFPEDVPLPGFDPERQLLERTLARTGPPGPPGPPGARGGQGRQGR